MSLVEDIKSIQARDPAAPTFLEVVFGYNGFHALLFHRLNNAIWGLGLRALARFIANIGRILTGIEIHPEAKIGKRLFIDHGTGVVIGQTAIIGDDVTIYHGVTLGGVGRTDQRGEKRHPTIEDSAMIGAGAQVLGDITVGKHAKVGSNSVVTNDIPEGKTALGIPARVIGGDEVARGYGMPSREEMEQVNFTIDCIVKEMGHIRKELNIEGPSPATKPKKKKPAAKKKASTRKPAAKTEVKKSA
ncbi:MAG: serine O-acetyltransferase [Alphaproteobacteria bacterium]|nr:serine O-acetyltransferase [Alphaproteobacteria bacterium]